MPSYSVSMHPYHSRFASFLLVLFSLSGTAASQELLPALMQAALAHHPALRAQGGMREAAQAGVEGARWQYWATPSINLERVNTSDTSYRGDNSVTTLRLQQPLWTGGRLDGNLSKAEAQAVAAQADLVATRQQLVLRVLQAWSDALAAQGKLLSYEQSETVHLRLLGLVERRSHEGLSAQADTDLARSRIDGVRADLLSARAQRDTALDRLRLLTGLPVTASQLGYSSSSRPPEQALPLAELLAAAREQSPQIAKARAQGKVAEAEVTLAKATLSPEVFLRAERQYGNFHQSGQDPQNRVFIGVSSNFGGGLSSLSGLDAARARQRAAEEDVRAQVLTLDEQVQSDANLLRMTGERRSTLERVQQTSASVSSSWERQFLAGRKQWQDLMNATREQMQNDVQLADAIATQQLTGWRLAILAQGVSTVLERRLTAGTRQADESSKATYSERPAQ